MTLNPSDNVEYSGTGETVGVSITASCGNTDMRMSDGSQSKSVFCDVTGQWNDVITNCTGKLCQII